MLRRRGGSGTAAAALRSGNGGFAAPLGTRSKTLRETVTGCCRACVVLALSRAAGFPREQDIDFYHSLHLKSTMYVVAGAWRVAGGRWRVGVGAGADHFPPF